MRGQAVGAKLWKLPKCGPPNGRGPVRSHNSQTLKYGTGIDFAREIV